MVPVKKREETPHPATPCTEPVSSTEIVKQLHETGRHAFDFNDGIHRSWCIFRWDSENTPTEIAGWNSCTSKTHLRGGTICGCKLTLQCVCEELAHHDYRTLLFICSLDSHTNNANDLPFMHVKQERFMAKFMYRNFNAVFVGAKHLPNLVWMHCRVGKQMLRPYVCP